jgi:basic membrane lipoprotein Med (substrate-binding protein (PBP1-ABC) superfamily)
VSKLIAVLAAAAAILLIVAGCGGGSDSSSESSSITKAQFIKQADAICAKGNKENEAEFEKFAKEKGLSEKKEPTKAQQEEAISEIVGPGVQKQIEEIDALGAPEGDEGKIEAMIDAVEEGVEEIEENPAALVEGKNPLAKGSKLAKEYGLKTCGEEG